MQLKPAVCMGEGGGENARKVKGVVYHKVTHRVLLLVALGGDGSPRSCPAPNPRAARPNQSNIGE